MALQTQIPEVLSLIEEDLDLESIKSLRLTCKSLSAPSFRFRHFVAKQSTDLTAPSLQQQNELASHPVLGPLVRELVVVAVVYDTSELERMIETKRRVVVKVQGPIFHSSEPACTKEELRRAKEDLQWMRGQQKIQEQQGNNITDVLTSLFQKYGRLESIVLDACLVKEPGTRLPANKSSRWALVMIQATEVYRSVMAAMAESQVSTAKLNVFGDTQRCSVQSIDITAHMAQLNKINLECIKHFSLSFATRCKLDVWQHRTDEGSRAEVAFREDQYDADDPEATVEDNFFGIPELLKKMPNLEHLELFMLHTFKQGGTNECASIITKIAEDVHFPHLSKLIIRGLPATEAALRKFFTNHSKITHLELHEVSIAPDSWRDILASLPTTLKLSYLKLSNLWAERGLFNLTPKNPPAGSMRIDYRPNRWSYPCQGGSMIHTREFTDVEEGGLKFTETRLGRQLGSPAAMNWSRKRHLEYFV